MTSKPPATPFTVIGGFLGAGKTTFLNHILRTGAERIAVLVNDFGAVNIDAGLIARHDGTTMTLTNGCVCCSIGGGFIETLGGLLDSGIRFDRIVIEASGVGDPWRIAEIALVEPSLRLDQVIVLADASRIEALLSDSKVGDTVRNQFAQATVVLLTKTDLANDATVGDARRAVASFRSDIRIIATSQHALPVLPDLTSQTASLFRADPVSIDARHEEGFARWSYQRAGAFDRVRFEEALALLPAALLRFKGSCRFTDDETVFTLQMVERHWSLIPVTEAQDLGDSDIVLIGVGTSDLPATDTLDSILDLALAAPSHALLRSPSSFTNEGQRPCR